MPRSHRPGGTTDRGLGWKHQQQRAALLARHVDGTPCPCQTGPLPCSGPGCLCQGSFGLPMYRDAQRNPDGLPLEADHETPRSLGGTEARRLLLATCNRSRGNGSRGTAAPLRTVTSRDWYRLDALRVAPVAFAIEVAPDRSRAVVAAAGWRGDNRTHVELVQAGRTAGWVVDAVMRLVIANDPYAVALRKTGQAGSLLVALENVGIEALAMTAAEVVQASGAFYDAVMTDDSVRHLGDPLLAEAVRAATKRGPDNSWAFDCKDARDIPLLAAVLARHALEVSGAPRPAPAAPQGGVVDGPRSETHELATAGF